MMKKKWTAALVTVIVTMMLLAGTALAVGLNYSLEVTATTAARSAVMEKYGLSREAMDMFWPGIETSGQEMVINFAALDVFGESIPQAGCYTVTIAKDGSAAAKWTYDGVDPASYAGGSLDAEVWGAEQMLAYRQKRDQENRSAAGDASAGIPANEVVMNQSLLKAGDISYENAVELVAQVLQEQCGVSRAVFDASGFAYADVTQEDGYRQWNLCVQSFEEQCSWTVAFNAETGEILQLVVDPFANSNG